MTINVAQYETCMSTLRKIVDENKDASEKRPLTEFEVHEIETAVEFMETFWRFEK